jgi:hypothetical protein
MPREIICMETLQPPICETCGNAMDGPRSTDVVYDEEKVVRLSNGRYRLGPPLKHRHTFRCEHCVPPSVVVEVPYQE